jgi:WD40 repeat protein
VRRITIGLRQVQGQDAIGATEHGVRGFPKRTLFGLRPVYCAIAATAIAVATLSDSEPLPRVSGSHVGRGDAGHQLCSFAYSRTGKHMAMTDTAGRVTLATRRTSDSEWEVERFLDFPGYARVVAFTADGRSVAAGGIGPGICLWDLSCPGSEPAQLPVIPIERVKRIVFSPDGQSLAITTDRDRGILIWDLAARRVRMVLDRSSSVANMAFSPDGRWLASAGSEDRSIVLWDLRTGRRQVLLENGPFGVMGLAFSPDGSMLAATSSAEHDVGLWDLESRRVRRVCAGHTRSLNSVAFSPDGSLLATVGNDGTLGLWAVATGERRASLDNQARWAHAVAFSPDGQTLALATGDDDYVRLWDVAEVLGAP